MDKNLRDSVKEQMSENEFSYTDLIYNRKYLYCETN